MTSGNVSDEPIAYRDDDALARLARHRRPASSSTTARSTRAPTTRSCARSRAGAPLRAAALARLRARERSRCPRRPRRPLLACGAELKNTFCLAKGDARLGRPPHRRPRELRDAALVHRGDRALRAAVRGRRPRSSPTTCTPSTCRPSTRSSATACELVGVQHHHAHLAACLAEHGEPGPAVGAIFDGTGYGTDGTVWGGELLRRRPAPASSASGTCWPVRAARRRRGDPRSRGGWRARGWRRRASDEPPPRRCAARRRARLGAGRRAGSRPASASPLTTSMGRLFDAVAALCGLRAEVSYEGQAAIELEAACDPASAAAIRSSSIGADGLLVIDPRETIRAVAPTSPPGVAPGGGRAPLPRARSPRRPCEACARSPRRSGHRPRRAVRRRVPEPAAARGGRGRAARAPACACSCPSGCPPNDGGISYGQAAVAARRDGGRLQ